MISFFCNKRPIRELLRGFDDYHSHILPSVDDGVRSDEEAIEVLRYLETLGVKSVRMTPHIMESYPRNSASHLRTEFERFSKLYEGNIELRLGAEYMLDARFMEHLRSSDMLTIKENHILVESSCIGASGNIVGLIRESMAMGYFVVLAHPERYLFMEAEEYRRLKEMGVLFQMNIASIVGAYGDQVEQRAKSLLRESYYNLLGGDIHSLSSFKRVVDKGRIESKYMKILAQIRG